MHPGRMEYLCEECSDQIEWPRVPCNSSTSENLSPGLPNVRSFNASMGIYATVNLEPTA